MMRDDDDGGEDAAAAAAAAFLSMRTKRYPGDQLTGGRPFDVWTAFRACAFAFELAAFRAGVRVDITFAIPAGTLYHDGVTSLLTDLAQAYAENCVLEDCVLGGGGQCETLTHAPTGSTLTVSGV